MTASAAASSTEHADQADGKARAMLAEIDALMRANRAEPDRDREFRLVELRHRVFQHLPKQTLPPRVALDPSARSRTPTVPECTAAEVTAARLERSVRGDGCLLVRDLVPAARVTELVEGIQRAQALRELGPPGDDATPWYRPLPLDPKASHTLGRKWVGASGGLLTIDSPRMLFLLLDTYERAGLHEVVTQYLGERPALSANKSTLRKVAVDTNASWHQDGAFLGPNLRALNIWLALTDCGRDAPGLDVIPRRFDHIVETGTGGSYFDWAVGPEIVDRLAAEAPVARPLFKAGDALIFDDMFLHQTATDPSMTQPRYAIESWFFAPSAYPDEHVPLVW